MCSFIGFYTEVGLCYVWYGDEPVAAMQREGNRSQLYMGRAGISVRIVCELLFTNSSTGAVEQVWYYDDPNGVIGKTEYRLCTGDIDLEQFDIYGSITIERSGSQSGTFYIYGNSGRLRLKVMFLNVGTSTQRTGISADSYVASDPERIYDNREIAVFDGNNNEISTQYVGRFFHENWYYWPQSYDIPEEKGYSVAVSAGRCDMSIFGDNFYPTFVYSSLPANSAVPVLPCFVLDKSNYGLYYFD